MRYLVFGACAVAILACTKPDVVDEATFMDCYANMLIIKASTQDSTVAAQQVAQFLASRHVTTDQMLAQLHRYADDPPRYRRVLAGINDRLRGLDSLARARDSVARSGGAH